MSFPGIVGLLTRFPARTESLEETARSVHWLPLVGLMVGGVLYVVSVPMILFLPLDLAAILLLMAVYILTGVLHLDGLADLGDALALPASPEERRRVMKDINVGAGGILAVVSILLLQLVSFRILLLAVPARPLYGILPLGLLASALISSELAAKMSMGACMAVGRPVEGGMGATFVRSTGSGRMALVMALSILIAVGLAGTRGLLVLMGAAVGTAVALLANHALGGVSGDVLGASNELGRAVTLAAWAVMLWTL